MDRYQLLTEQGTGSYAVVWKARDKETGQLVAIKELKEDFPSWDACLRQAEVRHQGRVQHPNVVRLIKAARVQRKCDVSLFQLLSSFQEQARRFSEDQIRWIMRHILEGLAHLHSQGLLHRDIKPENIMITREGAKISDFGQARFLSRPGTMTAYVSTRWYRAPELLLGMRRYSPAVDVWATGVLMAELLTLRPIFAGTSDIDQIFKIGSTLGAPTHWRDGSALADRRGISLPTTSRVGFRRILPRHTSPGAIQVVEAMVAWNPDERQSARDVLRLPFFREGRDVAPPILRPRERKHEAVRTQEAAATAMEELQASLAQSASQQPAAGGGKEGNPAASRRASFLSSSDSDDDGSERQPMWRPSQASAGRKQPTRQRPRGRLLSREKESQEPAIDSVSRTPAPAALPRTTTGSQPALAGEADATPAPLFGPDTTAAGYVPSFLSGDDVLTSNQTRDPPSEPKREDLPIWLRDDL